MKWLNKAQLMARRIYVWRFAVIVFGFYAFGFAIYYLAQSPSEVFEIALLLCVILFAWVLLAWLFLLLFLQLPAWQPPQSWWQKLKQHSHKLWYQALLWCCLLLSIASLYLMAKAFKALVSQLV